METQGINFSYRKLVTKFRFHGEVMGNPDLLWRAALWLLLFAVIIIGVTGYLTYEWAVSADETHVPAKTDRPTLSLTELESVISLYQKKQMNFTQLLRRAPKPPSYQRARSVPVATSTLSGESETLPLDTTPLSPGGLPR